MLVSLSITLKTFKFLTWFKVPFGMIDAGVTCGGTRGPDPPAQSGKIYEKLVTHKTHCNNWSKIRFLSRLKIRILGSGK